MVEAVRRVMGLNRRRRFFCVKGRTRLVTERVHAARARVRDLIEEIRRAFEAELLIPVAIAGSRDFLGAHA